MKKFFVWSFQIKSHFLLFGDKLENKNSILKIFYSKKLTNFFSFFLTPKPLKTGKK
jgi:hypothetical protein